MKTISGYFKILLDINLTTGQIKKTQIPQNDLENFIGGRGLGAKILWDRLKPNTNPLSPENVLLFLTGPFNGFPIPSSSRICVVTKSPRTSPVNSKNEHASTITYTNMGGFFAPELRFAGYDGIAITGKADKPIYINIVDEKVEILDASQYWGMGTDEFDRKFIEDLGNRRTATCYIGPAGEKMVPYACIINTAGRAAGRGGAGCVMGSKNLKAIAVKGSKMPNVADHKKYVELIDAIRNSFAEDSGSKTWWRSGGTTHLLTSSSDNGTQAVKNYREATFEFSQKLGSKASRQKIWKRDFACYSCQLSCKKSGNAKGAYGGLIHDGPEYETGTMFGANLLISDLEGLNKCIFVTDDYGMDIISAGNVIGFLMEAYEKNLIDKDFLDGIDLRWGNVDATLEMIHKIGKKDGVGIEAGKGVKYLANKIGQGSEKFAIHVKGLELAGWNVQKASEWFGISYTQSNRGACHMNGGTTRAQDDSALRDSLGACNFADDWYKEDVAYHRFLTAITGIDWTQEKIEKASERIFNMEKLFNYREGFNRSDDVLPDRFYDEPLTYGEFAGSVVKREDFENLLNEYYTNRGWDLETTRPNNKKLEELELNFAISEIQ